MLAFLRLFSHFLALEGSLIWEAHGFLGLTYDLRDTRLRLGLEVETVLLDLIESFSFYHPS